MPYERVQRCLQGGVSVLVGSVNSEGVPACCRGIAIRSDDELTTLTLYVPSATSQQVIANVATTRRVAVVASEPISHWTTQIKGTTTNVRVATEAEREFIRTRLHEFAEVLAQIGLPKKITKGANFWPAFAIELTIHEIFDQTPGPRAGVAIE
jgi:hypothetical protein